MAFPPRPEQLPSGPAFLEWFDEFLSESDVDDLNEGLETFWRAFSRLPPEAFPQAVFYTDTSARPLAFLFRPLLQTLAARAGRPEPETAFLVTHRSDVIIDALWDEGVDWDRLPALFMDRRAQQIDKMLDKYRRQIARLAHDPLPETRERLAHAYLGLREIEAERRALPQNALAWRRHLEDLVERLSLFAKRSAERHPGAECAPFLVIDEHVDRAQTVKLLLMACREANRRLVVRPGAIPLEMRVFTFGDRRVDEDEAELRPTLPYRDFRRELGDRYLVGCRHGSAGEFQYATSERHREPEEEADPLRRERAIGVRKDSSYPYALRSPVADPWRMRALRRLLAAIGAQKTAELVAREG